MRHADEGHDNAQQELHIFLLLRDDHITSHTHVSPSKTRRVAFATHNDSVCGQVVCVTYLKTVCVCVCVGFARRRVNADHVSVPLLFPHNL